MKLILYVGFRCKQGLHVVLFSKNRTKCVFFLNVWNLNYKSCKILTRKHWKDCKRNFKWPSMRRWLCPIHNGTLETFIRSMRRKIFSKSIKLIISMRFSSSRNAPVTLLKNSKLKIIGFHIYKHWYLIHTYQTKGTVVNRVLPTVHWGSLEIML